MSDNLTQSHHDPLDTVIADYIQQVETGSVPDREALLAAHPELAERLRAFFADYDRLDRQAAELHLSHGTHLTADWPEPAIDLPRVRYFGDYELLEVIARGGMGVVYKARQVSLNRVVALKMLLAGELATKRDASRFQAEAEAAAALDHPQIVPIFEIGVHEGRQYFSMKYVDGSSLSNLPRGDVRSEAERLIVIARAVHFAHERGVLHRDLKPGNVLVDSRGSPFVADFGLAKRTDSNRSLSESGAMVGTPRYMAPEQAAGRKDLTVAADIYSLGVVLYERLTGAPPFTGATAAETVFKIQNEEPVSPRQCNRGVPRDLETICLHCLHKDPTKRYATAAELADDLGRFVAGDPVRARPLGIAERIVRWSRRHRTALIATASAAAAVALVMMLPRPTPPVLTPTPTPIASAPDFAAPEWLVRADTAAGQLTGPCWRTMEQNVLATSMAGLGMSQADSPRPAKLEVRWKQGQPEERVFAVVIAKVDEAMQIVMLRLEGNDVPKPRARPADFATPVIDRARDSVVRVKAKRKEGTRFGSGFVAQPGLVITAAQVLGMQDRSSQPPEKIDVVARAGTQTERSYEGELLVVDRNENLAVIRIKGQDLPDPLPIVSSAEVHDSQRLINMGYPSGATLVNLKNGLEVVPTVKARPCTVTGRLLNKLGIVKYLQVEGGADPGASGAAVLDTNGDVVGVLAAENANSNLKFVVPSEYVTNLLDGRVLEVVIADTYRWAGSIRTKVSTHIANPTKRFNELSLEIWTSPAPALKRPGEAQNARLAVRPASKVTPIPLPGDGPIVATKLDYDPEQNVRVGDGQFTIDVFDLPERKANEVYWLRPRYHLTSGGDYWGEAMVVEMGTYPVDVRPAALAVKLTPDSGPDSGRTITLDTRCAVTLENAAGVIGTNEQNMRTTLKETVRAVEANGNARVRLQYVNVHLNDFDLDPAFQKQMREALDSVKAISAHATMNSDGQLTVAKRNWAEVPVQARKVLVAFDSQVMDSLELLSIALPNKEVHPMAVLPMKKKLTLQLGSSPVRLETVQFEGHCEYRGMRVRGGRAEAVIRFMAATRLEDEKKGLPSGVFHGEAIVDLATGQVILETLKANLMADFEAGKLNKDPTHATINFEATLRRTTSEPPASLDPRTMLPNQTVVLSPLVGVGVP